VSRGAGARVSKIALVFALCATCMACGNGSLVLIDDGNGEAQDTIKFQGNIRDLNPEVAGARIVVFVFTNLSARNVGNDGRIKFNDDGTFDFDKQRSVAVDTDAEKLEFTVTQIESGNLTVVFLQDDVSNPDGQIDPGDPHVILSDPDNVLENARNGETIKATDVDIDLVPDPADDSVSAEAVTLRSIRDDTGSQ